MQITPNLLSLDAENLWPIMTDQSSTRERPMQLKPSNYLTTLILMLSLVTGANISAQMNHEEHSSPAMNYHIINDRLATGGHFVDDGLQTIAAGGVNVVIDLRDNPPSGQREKLADQGIQWINIPITWKDPKAQDFVHFSTAMTEHLDKNVLVQCQANYRASAMTYLYRVKVQGVAPEIAGKDLHAIWQPNDQWSEYMDGILH